jgi:hypothetical protein
LPRVPNFFALTDPADYRWLNDVVGVGVGEVRSNPGRTPELVLGVSAGVAPDS